MSIYDFKTAVEDINAAILDKYIRASGATIKKRCNAFLLADGGNSEHFFDIRVDLDLVSIKLKIGPC